MARFWLAFGVLGVVGASLACSGVPGGGCKVGETSCPTSGEMAVCDGLGQWQKTACPTGTTCQTNAGISACTPDMTPPTGDVGGGGDEAGGGGDEAGGGGGGGGGGEEGGRGGKAGKRKAGGGDH